VPTRSQDHNQINTTFYLYGLGSIGEKTSTWNFALPDGLNTPRQLTDMQGDVTLSTRYTPWSGALDTYGTGNFTYGYLGGILDVATNLIYVGNGQYYDPSTGRFLTRDINPDSANPYIPWNPIGAIVGPLGLISLIASHRKKGGKASPYLLMFIMLVVLPLGIGMACNGEGPTEVTAVVTSDGTAVITFGPTTVVTNVTPSPGSGQIDITAIPCLTPLENVPSPTSTPTPTPGADVRLTTIEERIMAVKQAVLIFHGAIPVELVLAIASVETGPVFNWDNEVANGDGIMQVTIASGYHEKNGEYVNTRAGIEANIKDGVSVLTERLNAVQVGFRGDYGNVFDNLIYSDLIQATLQYNGGPFPIRTYKDGLGVRDYLARVSGGLTNIVPTTFGYSNSALANELMQGQTQVDNLLR